MAWLDREKAPIAISERIDTPDGLWEKCVKCSEIILRKELHENLNVCPKCDHHYPLSVWDRIHSLVDEGSFVETDDNLYSADLLVYIGEQYEFQDKFIYSRDCYRRAKKILQNNGMKGTPQMQNITRLIDEIFI